jgi:hypothetical protein
VTDTKSPPEPSERVMRAAARLYVTCDKKLGFETPAWIKDLAEEDRGIREALKGRRLPWRSRVRRIWRRDC